MQKREGMAKEERKMGPLKKIFILHGWTYASSGNNSLKKWDPFLEELLSQNYRPVLLKIPGLTKDVAEVWDLDKYVEWFKKTIAKESQIILIGHSNGGRIALSFAQKYPEKISKLILIDSAGIYHNELPIRIKRLIFKTLAKIGKKLTSSETLKVILYKLAREGDYKNATPAQRQTMLNLMSTDLSDILKKIKIPTLIIWGKEDKVTPLSDGKLMHNLIQNSKLSVIKKARHSPQFTSPKEVAKIIHEYI